MTSGISPGWSKTQEDVTVRGRRERLSKEVRDARASVLHRADKENLAKREADAIASQRPAAVMRGILSLASDEQLVEFCATVTRIDGREQIAIADEILRDRARQETQTGTNP